MGKEKEYTAAVAWHQRACAIKSHGTVECRTRAGLQVEVGLQARGVGRTVILGRAIRWGGRPDSFRNKAFSYRTFWGGMLKQDPRGQLLCNSRGPRKIEDPKLRARVWQNMQTA